MKKARMLEALLALLSVSIFLGAAEGVVRWLDPDLSLPQAEHHFRFTQEFEFELPHHRRDPVLGWRLAPGQYGSMRVNSQGFRGAEFSLQARGDLRIAHLGDSCTMGFTISSDQEIYSSRLARMLAQEGIRAETMNFGVDGYSSHQGRKLLEVVEPYRPDYVTIYFGYNDHHYSNASDSELSYGEQPSRAFLERSHFYRFLRRHLMRALGREARLVEPKRRVPPAEFEMNLRSMIRSVRDWGGVPILLTTPLRSGVPLIENEVPDEGPDGVRWVTQDWWVKQNVAGQTDLLAALERGLEQHPDWPYLHYLRGRELLDSGRNEEAQMSFERAADLDQERIVMDSYNETVRKVAAETRTKLLDLDLEFEKRSKTQLFNDVVHPNRIGHAMIAKSLFTEILRIERIDK